MKKLLKRVLLHPFPTQTGVGTYVYDFDTGKSFTAYVTTTFLSKQVFEL